MVEVGNGGTEVEVQATPMVWFRLTAMAVEHTLLSHNFLATTCTASRAVPYRRADQQSELPEWDTE